MIITAENINKIALGTLRICEEDGYFQLYRFDEDHLKELEDYGCGRKMYGMANIKLEFFTKGGELSFDYKVSPGTVREYYSIDVLADGVFKYNVAKNVNVDEDRFCFSIPQKDIKQRITVYFPSTAQISIKNLSLPEDWEPHRRALRILTYGDSLVQGYHPNHFQNTVMNIVSDYFCCNMVNQAIGGDCFREINVKKVDFEPDYITVGYGINDWCTGRLGKGESTEKFIRRITEVYPGVKILLILPDNNDYIEKTRQNNDIVNPIADDGGKLKTFDDIRELLESVADKFPDVVCINMKNTVPQYSDCFVADNVHLTDLGNVIYATGFIKQAKEYIK